LSIGGAVIAGSGAGAAVAATLTDSDLAYVRLLVGAELLAVDFYTRAIASQRVGGSALGNLKHALANESAHYTSLSTVLAGSGQVAATAGDIDFTYPARSFASTEEIEKLGLVIETTMLGAYLGAVDGLQANMLKRPFAQIAANESEHLSVFSSELLGRPIGNAFASSYTIDDVSGVLGTFES
jgi:hypothetical protein